LKSTLSRSSLKAEPIVNLDAFLYPIFFVPLLEPNMDGAFEPEFYEYVKSSSSSLISERTDSLEGFLDPLDIGDSCFFGEGLE